MIPSEKDYLRAKQIVDQHECGMRGHDWGLTEQFGSQYPAQLICRRQCGLEPAKIVPPNTASAGHCPLCLHTCKGPASYDPLPG